MPNTDAYLALGVGVTLTILASYSLSLLLRFRQTTRLIQTLETLKDER
jgi:hypothetical protein